MDSFDAPTPVRTRWSCVDDLDPPLPEPISPELVLVDPELARRVRPVAVVGPPPPPPQTRPIAVAETRPRAARRSPGLRLALTAVGAAALIALVTFATASVPRPGDRPYVEASSPREDVTTPAREVATTGAPTIGAAPTTTRSQPANAPVATAPTRTTEAAPVPLENTEARIVLRWRPVPSADYYNVILWGEGTRLRDFWPRRPRLVLEARELVRLGAPTGSAVHWFVYPIRSEAGGRVAGPVRAHGAVTVPARQGR